jgi:hypothetical protein
MARSIPKPVAKSAPDEPSVVQMTAADRADYIVARLEQFIRDGSKDEKGMSFDQWKNMARSEISIAIAEAETSQKYDELASKRVLFVSATAMVTIGFWGTVTSLGKLDYMIGALVCGAAGLVLLLAIGNWRLRTWAEMRESRRRREILGRVEGLTKRIRKLEKELETEIEDLEQIKKKAARRRLILTGGNVEI